MKIVEVVWFDAQTSTQGLFVDELSELEPVLSRSVGYLVKECEDYVILSFTCFNNDFYKHFQLIPTGMIKEIKVLEEVK